MRRRFRHKKTTEAQRKAWRKKARRDRRNYRSRGLYDLNQKFAFYEEYKILCRKYGCYIGSLSGSWVSKNSRSSKYYRHPDHLDTVLRQLQREIWEFEEARER